MSIPSFTWEVVCLRRMDPADWTSLFEKPQCSQRNDMTMISRKYGIDVRRSLVTPCRGPLTNRIQVQMHVTATYLFMASHAQRFNLLYWPLFVEGDLDGLCYYGKFLCLVRDRPDGRE